MDQSGGPQAGGAGGRTTYQALLAADAAWRAIRTAAPGAAGPAPTFVTESPAPLGAAALQGADAFDAVVCGGTLGVFLAAALARQGYRVAVVERAELRGRSQEWNISRKELEELRELGLLTSEEIDAAIAIEFNPVRVGFHGSADVWTRDVLNLGVRPDTLVQTMRAKLEAAGGAVLDSTQLLGLEVHPDGVALQVSGPPPAARSGDGSTTSSNSSGGGSGGGGARRVVARLVLDCMGHQSPIVRQIRWGVKPDGICLVVGGCASGFPPEANTTADIICTASDAEPLISCGGPPLQLFWEAFPSSDSPDSRTTYMFTYSDAQPFRPSLVDMFEEYWRRLPQYQGLAEEAVEQLQFKRLLFAFFPTYKNSPLPPAFDRVLQVGDASGIQSPLSFGGFGALTRHARRLIGALDDALACDALSREDLGLVNAYNPSLSSAWMLQRAMTAARSQREAAPPGLINGMLGGNFAAMEGLGDAVMRPFLQDVLQFGPLVKTMTGQMVRDPAIVPQLIAHIGMGPLIQWTSHVAALGAYSALHAAAAPALAASVLPRLAPREAYRLRRRMEAWEFGSGGDYKM